MGLFAHLPTLPYIPGRDGAGTVTKVGSKVDSLKVIMTVVILPNFLGTGYISLHFLFLNPPPRAVLLLKLMIVIEIFLLSRLATVSSFRVQVDHMLNTWRANRIPFSN